MDMTIYRMSGTPGECAAAASIFAAADSAGGTLLDTSAIIDGRVAPILEQGFLHKVVVPDFVLEELQHLADSPDLVRRTKGRDGLDLVADLKATGLVAICDGSRAKNGKGADARLVELALADKSQILTRDLNLAKVAKLRGVRVLSIDDLVDAIVPKMAVGDEFPLKILRLGSSPGQGVGFACDGGMIVVDRASQYVGSEIQVRVTNVRRTEGGRLTFAVPTLAPPPTPLDSAGLEKYWEEQEKILEGGAR
jgi:uncharacterized protein YacL